MTGHPKRTTFEGDQPSNHMHGHWVQYGDWDVGQKKIVHRRCLRSLVCLEAAHGDWTEEAVKASLKLHPLGNPRGH